MKQIFMAAVLLLASHGQAAELSENGSKELTDQVMVLLAANKVSAGFDLLKPHWLLSEKEFTDMAAKTEQLLSQISTRFGAMLGMEFVTSQHAGKSLLRHIYMQKFAKHVLRWQFTFYKPQGQWFLSSVRFDEQIDMLFK